MKKYFVLSIGLLLFISVTTQAQNTCASVFNPQVIQTSDPSRYNRYMQLE